MTIPPRIVLSICLFAGAASAAMTVEEVRLRALGGEQVRPLDSVVIETGVFGEDQERNNKVKGRLQMTPEVKINGEGKGWLSKPFSCPENERQLGRYVSASNGTLASILGIVSNFTIKDCILFTASPAAGDVEIEAQANGKSTKLKLQVTPGAQARSKSEEVVFPDEERPQDPYRELAEYYAPFVAQETWFSPKADYLARFDYDGDWSGSNNWENLETGSSQAYVYYAVMETHTHWFLIYNFFHPRDYSDRCVAGSCHENDNEGIVVTVRKDGSKWGQLQVVETLAHNNIYSHVADRRIRDGLHDIDGPVEIVDGSRPVVFIESGGHGVYGSSTSHSRYKVNEDKFTAGTGVTYVYKGVAERPRHPDDRRVGYELLPILYEWWPKANTEARWNANTFDAFYTYQPFGNRPGAAFQSIAGCFLGLREGANKAKPFWGWHDERTRKRNVLATGQWGLDPAYAVSQNLLFPSEDPFSLDYVYNPYLGIGELPADAVARLDRGSRGSMRRTDPAAGSSPAAAPAPQSNRADDSWGTASPTPSNRSDSGFGGSGGGWNTPLVDSDLPGDLLVNANNDLAKYNFDPAGNLTFRGRVDGEIRFHIRGDQVSAVRASGRPAEVDTLRFTQPLPVGEYRRVDVQKRAGRGEVRLLQQPSASNEYTAIVLVNDPKGGDDLYDWTLSWQQ